MKVIVSMLSVIFTLAIVGPVFSEDNAAMQAPAVTTEKTVEVGNKICPVSGEKVVAGHEGKIEYQGKVYNLCCQMCEKDFNKDPQKYIEKLQKMEQEAAGSEQAK